MSKAKAEVHRFKSTTGKYYDTIEMEFPEPIECGELFHFVHKYQRDPIRNQSEFIFVVTGNGEGIRNLHPKLFK